MKDNFNIKQSKTSIQFDIHPFSVCILQICKNFTWLIQRSLNLGHFFTDKNSIIHCIIDKNLNI